MCSARQVATVTGSAAAGSWAAGGTIVMLWAALLVLVFVLGQRVTVHERAHFRYRRWAHAALPALPLGCLVFLVTGKVSWGVVMFTLVWALGRRSTHPVAPNTDKKPPTEPRYPQRGPMC